MSKNDKRIIGFEEKSDIISEIYRRAETQGIARSGWLRQTIREKLGTDAK